jgi:hydrogenase maturation protease
MQHEPLIAVIGCGNANRSDDGVGPEVVRALSAREVCKDGRVRLLDAGIDGMAVMFAARGCRSLILIDACRSGSRPGEVFEIPGSRLEAPHAPAFTLHDFRWNHALYAGRRIFGECFVTDVTVLLVEADSIDFGVGLSPPIADAALTVTRRVEAIVRSRLELECA